MLKDFWFYFFILLGVILIAGIIMVSIENNNCIGKGGVTVKTVGGYECVKLEKIK